MSQFREQIKKLESIEELESLKGGEIIETDEFGKMRCNVLSDKDEELVFIGRKEIMGPLLKIEINKNDIGLKDGIIYFIQTPEIYEIGRDDVNYAFLNKNMEEMGI